MKLFLDTAIVDEVREAASWGIVSGVTTNPTLVMKSGRNFKEVVIEICNLVDGPVSAEVTSDKAEDMLKEAREFVTWHENVVVKFPMTQEGMKAVSRAAKEGIESNVTLVFTPQQALVAARAGATMVSPFVGRLDDIKEDGMQVVRECVAVFRNYPEIETKVLAASIRHTEHVRQAALAGADYCTMPFSVMKELFNHPLTDAGLKRFKEDWEKAKK